jgi:urea transport system ATP-binding protein
MTRRERERTGQLLESIARDRSTLMVEHDMEFVRHFARTITVLHAGKVLCEGGMDQVQNDPRVIEVYLGRGEYHRKMERGQIVAHGDTAQISQSTIQQYLAV